MLAVICRFGVLHVSIIWMRKWFHSYVRSLMLSTWWSLESQPHLELNQRAVNDKSLLFKLLHNSKRQRERGLKTDRCTLQLDPEFAIRFACTEKKTLFCFAYIGGFDHHHARTIPNFQSHFHVQRRRLLFAFFLAWLHAERRVWIWYHKYDDAVLCNPFATYIRRFLFVLHAQLHRDNWRILPKSLSLWISCLCILPAKLLNVVNVLCSLFANCFDCNYSQTQVPILLMHVLPLTAELSVLAICICTSTWSTKSISFGSMPVQWGLNCRNISGNSCLKKMRSSLCLSLSLLPDFVSFYKFLFRIADQIAQFCNRLTCSSNRSLLRSTMMRFSKSQTR